MCSKSLNFKTCPWGFQWPWRLLTRDTVHFSPGLLSVMRGQAQRHSALTPWGRQTAVILSLACPMGTPRATLLLVICVPLQFLQVGHMSVPQAHPHNSSLRTVWNNAHNTQILLLSLCVCNINKASLLKTGCLWRLEACWSPMPVIQSLCGKSVLIDLGGY